ncbi:uncharacterized protein LOC130657566 [Hydractinia symbiolongicarpus]|uniref:uncharacterized protein LOC130657566 n=1 Tax=Hydractinia symbiolongicarpus TaxID=13093 RepID=UPI0025512F5C|nr:uncharacterized protein LOC130657566 [Hydractinia symbiolongicarpus]
MKIPSTFDGACAGEKCKQCIKACNYPQPFDLRQCQCDCGTSDECFFGCLFYAQLTGASDQEFITLQPRNRPNASQSLITVGAKTKADVQLSWPNVVTSAGLFTVGSVYAISLDVDYVGHREQVYGLTTKKTFTLSLSDICSTFGLYGRFERITRITFSVYPINFNGWIEASRIESTEILPQSISPVQNVIIETPPAVVKNFQGFPVLTYTVKWTPPSDPDTLAVLNKKVKVSYDILNCTSQINYQAIVRLLNIGEQLVDLVSIIMLP